MTLFRSLVVGAVAVVVVSFLLLLSLLLFLPPNAAAAGHFLLPFEFLCAVCNAMRTTAEKPTTGTGRIPLRPPGARRRRSCCRIFKSVQLFDFCYTRNCNCSSRGLIHCAVVVVVVVHCGPSVCLNNSQRQMSVCLSALEVVFMLLLVCAPPKPKLPPPPPREGVRWSTMSHDN